MTKSRFAFEASCRRLWEESGGKVFFWTLTFEKHDGDEAAFASWAYFRQAMKREFGEVGGLRVVEVHPGNDRLVRPSHGLHFHFLITRRLAFHLVQRVAMRCGFGEVAWVRQCETVEECFYLGKYLSKAQDGLPKGTRRWQAWGGFKGSKVKDIEITSTRGTIMREIRPVFMEEKENGKMQLNFAAFFAAVELFAFRSIENPEIAKTENLRAWSTAKLKARGESLRHGWARTVRKVERIGRELEEKRAEDAAREVKEWRVRVPAQSGREGQYWDVVELIPWVGCNFIPETDPF